MYDIGIVGGGPAAWSCALTGKMRNLNVAVMMSIDNESWLQRAEQVENYPGLPNISGKEMLNIFRKQSEDLGTDVILGTVRQIVPTGEHFLLLCGNEVIEAKTIVLATGAGRPRYLPGEEEYLGQGISYCGTCDGMFYKNKDVVVLSSGEQGVEEANFLSTLAQKVMYFSMKKHSLTNLDSSIVVHEQRPLSIEKNDNILTLNTREGAKYSADGLFIFRPAVALDQLIQGVETRGVFIDTNKKMETNVEGVYAAGDCVGQPLQIAKAVGEGNIAAISAAEYLQKKKV